MEVSQPVTILCCECGVAMQATNTNMCVNCMKTKIDITSKVAKEGVVYFCRHCERYLRPPWMHCELESSELLHLCLNKTKGLNKLKLIDAAFIWTEPHSRRLKVRCTVQKDVGGVILEQSFICEYVVTAMQCDDCRKSFTPHSWIANVQVRQRVLHQRTFFFLEQVLLKHKISQKVQSVKQKDQGIDFRFTNRSHANRFCDFVRSVVPVQVTHAKQLVSMDEHNNSYNYKYTFAVEIAPICANDLLLLPPDLSKSLGGIGPLVLVYKVTDSIHIVDPQTVQMAEIPGDRYWKMTLPVYATAKQVTECIVLDVEPVQSAPGVAPSASTTMEVEMSETSFRSNPAYYHRRGFRKFLKMDVELSRSDEVGVSSSHIYSHLGHVLKPGDTVLAYDLRSVNSCGDLELPANAPDFLIVKKVFPQRKANRKRIWKLRRMQVEKEPRPGEEDEFDEFMNDLEEDPEMRSKINLYRDESVAVAAQPTTEERKQDDAYPEVQLSELIDNLTLDS